MIDLQIWREHRQTVKRLGKLKVELKTKAVGSGLTEASKPIKKTMAMLAPKKSGALRKAIGQRRVSGRAAARLSLFGKSVRLDPGQVAILIGPNKKVAGRQRSYIANFLEFGTKPHTITAKNEGRLKLGSSGFAKTVRHPGIKAIRFQQRSLERHQQQIPELFRRGVNKRIDKLL